MFILTEQRQGEHEEFLEAWRRYAAYLEEHRGRFPPGAFSLATSSWYFNFADPRCPHDAWLETAIISEPARGQRHESRIASLRVRLLGAYHDGFIELNYPQVFAYHFETRDAIQGHGDWRYDEFRVTPDGHLVHKIEWWGLHENSRWLIEASDVEFSWHPVGKPENSSPQSDHG